MATDDTRQRILLAAGEVFAEQGFRDATIREICRKAGVNGASVNYYFGDKERLYVETVRRAHPGGPDPTEEFWPDDTPPVEKLRLYIRRLMHRLAGTDADAWKMRLMQREILNPTPACQEIMREYFQLRFGQLQRILDEILPGNTPDHQRHQIGFSIVGQCVYFRAASRVIALVLSPEEIHDHFGADELADHVAKVCLAALGLAPPFMAPSDNQTNPNQPGRVHAQDDNRAR